MAPAFRRQVTAPWRSLQSVQPDATQLADPAWRPQARGVSDHNTRYPGPSKQSKDASGLTYRTGRTRAESDQVCMGR
jgi:hypothetical protein